MSVKILTDQVSAKKHRILNGIVQMKVFLFLTALIYSTSLLAEVEPNNTSGTANRIQSAVSANGQLSNAADVDWYKMHITGGASFTLQAYLLQQNNEIFPYTLGTWVISVYRPSDMTKVAEYQTYFDKTERFLVNIDQIGDYYVSVAAKPSSFSSSRMYVLSITGQIGEPPAEESITVGDFEGIWQASTGHFISIHQTDFKVIAVLLGNSTLFAGWEALSGLGFNSLANLNTIQGYVDLNLSIELTSKNTLKAIQVSCKPLVLGYECQYPNGSVFTAYKVF